VGENPIANKHTGQERKKGGGGKKKKKNVGFPIISIFWEKKKINKPKRKEKKKKKKKGKKNLFPFDYPPPPGLSKMIAGKKRRRREKGGRHCLFGLLAKEQPAMCERRGGKKKRRRKHGFCLPCFLVIEKKTSVKGRKGEQGREKEGRKSPFSRVPSGSGATRKKEGGERGGEEKKEQRGNCPRLRTTAHEGKKKGGKKISNPFHSSSKQIKAGGGEREKGREGRPNF